MLLLVLLAAGILSLLYESVRSDANGASFGRQVTSLVISLLEVHEDAEEREVVAVEICSI